MLFSLLLTIPIALINHVGLPTHWGNLLVVAILNAVFSILYIISLSLLDISVFVPLLNLRTAFVPIIGALFLGEIFPPYQYLLIAIILLAGMFVSIDEKLSLRSFLKWSIFLAILCTLSYALIGIFIKKSIAENGFWEVTLWTAILSQIMLLFTFPFFRKDIHKLHLKQVASTFSMSLALLIGTVTSNLAYKDNVTITNIITSLPLSLIIVFLLSLIAPRLLEKHTPKVYAIRFTAASIMIISAIIISL